MPYGDGLVFATNVPAERLSATDVWVVSRCRGPIELRFKRANQLAGWGFRWGRTGARLRVEWYAQLLGRVVLPGGTLRRGGPLHGLSPWKRTRVVQEFARRLPDSLRQGVAGVVQVWTHLARQWARIRPQAKSRKNPRTKQLLLNPNLVA